MLLIDSFRSPVAETFRDRERRGEAMSVLDNPEALMAHAQAHGDVSSCLSPRPQPETQLTHSHCRASAANASNSPVNYAALTRLCPRRMVANGEQLIDES